MFKKVLAVVLSSVMALSLIGCGTSKTDAGEVKLGKYKGLVVYHDDVEVTDESYQQMVDYMLSQDTKTETVKKGKVKKDSIVNVDYVGKIEVDGEKVAFDGGAAQDTNINVATNASTEGTTYITGFSSELAGHKVGDEVTTKLKFPDDYGQSTKINDKSIDLSGKDVWFTFTINGIQKSTTPELTDKYVTEKYGTYGVTDLKSFEKYAKEQMRISNIMNKVWNDFKESCEVVSYDKKEEESLQKYYGSYYESQIQQQYGADLTTYLEACSMSEKDWNKQLKETADEQLKEKMIVQAIAEKENLVPEGKDYEAEAATLAEQNSVSVKELESKYGKEEVEYAIIYQKVQKFIAENVDEKEGSEPTTVPETTAAVAETVTEEATTEAK